MPLPGTCARTRGLSWPSSATPFQSSNDTVDMDGKFTVSESQHGARTRHQHITDGCLIPLERLLEGWSETPSSPIALDGVAKSAADGEGQSWLCLLGGDESHTYRPMSNATALGSQNSEGSSAHNRSDHALARSGAQLVTTLEATGPEHGSSGPGGRPSPEAMLAGSLEVVGLKRSLGHDAPSPSEATGSPTVFEAASEADQSLAAATRRCGLNGCGCRLHNRSDNRPDKC
jgi:hypothetical protein